MATDFAWAALERAASEQPVAAVRTVRAEHPTEHIYGAMFHSFYGDGDSICWPSLTVGTDETLAEVAARGRRRLIGLSATAVQAEGWTTVLWKRC